MQKTMDSTNTQSLLNHSLQNRIDQAFQIFTKYEDFLRSIIYLNLQNHFSVDDIMQDFFIHLVKNPIPDNIDDIKGYLYKAIINDIIDMARRNQRQEENMLKYTISYKKNVKQQIMPERNIVKKDKLLKLLKLIKKHLPPYQANALFHYYFSDCNISKAAKKMKVDPNTLSRYVCTGLKKCRSLFSYESFFEEELHY